MSKSNKSFKPYSKREENAILRIPAGTGNAQAFRDHAEKYGRTPEAVYQKHKALHESIAKGNVIIEDRKKETIPAMTFKSVEFDDLHKRVTPEEEISMQKGLDSAVDNELANTKRAILFPARLKTRAAQYLQVKHPKMVFAFHSNKADRKYVLLRRVS